MRNKFNSWIIAGLVLIFLSLGLTCFNLYDDYRAGQAMPDLGIETQSRSDFDMAFNSNPGEISIPDYILNPDMDMPVLNQDGHDYVGVLEIPSQDLKLSVISTLDYVNLKIAPCLYTGNIYQHNAIIGAHNYNSHFGKLKYLSSGDKIKFTDVDGNLFEYNIAGVGVLDKYAPDELDALSDTYDLILFTCTYGGKSRVVVKCNLINQIDWTDYVARI